MSVDNLSIPCEVRSIGFFRRIRAVIQRADGVPLRWFLVYLLVLSLLFSGPLIGLCRLAASSSLYSHIFLIPVISIYLVGARSRGLTLPNCFQRAWLPGLLFVAAGAFVLMVYQWLSIQGWQLSRVDYLAKSMISFLAFATGGAFLFLGVPVMRAIAFPWAFLIFLVPFPHVVENGIETFFQYASAEAAYLLMSLVDLPVFRDGLFFKLPGIDIKVAQECSGIRSSLVLFITSLFAGQMFLRSPWRRAILTLAVIPLAILRNGFRIFTISWLCVHVNPSMLDSPIHHRGGPIFFALSLIPFFGFLLLLRERPRKSSPETVPKPSSL